MNGDSRDQILIFSNYEHHLDLTSKTVNSVTVISAPHSFANRRKEDPSLLPSERGKVGLGPLYTANVLGS